MSKGNETFSEIADFFWKLNDENKIGNSNDKITNDEIRTISNDHGNLLCLFDKVFSIVNSKRDIINQEKRFCYFVAGGI